MASNYTTIEYNEAKKILQRAVHESIKDWQSYASALKNDPALLSTILSILGLKGAGKKSKKSLQDLHREVIFRFSSRSAENPSASHFRNIKTPTVKGYAAVYQGHLRTLLKDLRGLESALRKSGADIKSQRVHIAGVVEDAVTKAGKKSPVKTFKISLVSSFRRTSRDQGIGAGTKAIKLDYAQSIVNAWARQDLWEYTRVVMGERGKQVAVKSTQYIRGLITQPSGRWRSSGKNYLTRVAEAYETYFIGDYAGGRELEQVQSQGSTAEAMELINPSPTAKGTKAAQEGMEIVSGKRKTTSILSKTPDLVWFGLSFGNIRLMDQIKVFSQRGTKGKVPYPLWMILEFGTFGKFSLNNVQFADTDYIGVTNRGYGYVRDTPYGGYSTRAKAGRPIAAMSKEGYIPKVAVEIRRRLSARGKIAKYYPVNYGKGKGKGEGGEDIERWVMRLKPRYQEVKASGPFNTVEDGIQGRKGQKTGMKFAKESYLQHANEYNGIAGRHFLAAGISAGMADMSSELSLLYNVWRSKMEGIVRQLNAELARGDYTMLNAMRAEIYGPARRGLRRR